MTCKNNYAGDNTFYAIDINGKCQKCPDNCFACEYD